MASPSLKHNSRHLNAASPHLSPRAQSLLESACGQGSYGSLTPRKPSVDDDDLRLPGPATPVGGEKQQPFHDHEQGLQGTFWGSVFTLCNSCLGAGVLAFPFCFRQAGLLVGLAMCIVLGSILGLSCWILVYCCDVAQRTDPSVRTYHQLVQLVGGKRLATVVEAVLWLYLFGISLGFLVIAGDIAQPLVHRIMLSAGAAAGVTAIVGSRWFVVGIISAFVIWPLCLLKNIAALGRSSAVGVFGVLYLTAVLVVMLATHGVGGAVASASASSSSSSSPTTSFEMVTSWRGAFLSMPLIGFALGCHIQAPIIFSTLPDARGGHVHDGSNGYHVHIHAHADAQDRGGGGRLDVFTRVLVLAFSICIAIYMACGLCGYLLLGNTTPQDVLDNAAPGSPLSWGNAWVDVARACVLVTSVCGFPLNHLPARAALWSLYHRTFLRGRRGRLLRLSPELDEMVDGQRSESEHEHPPKMPTAFSLIETTIYVVLTALGAIFFDNLATLFDLFGAICGSFEILVIPGLLWAHFGPPGACTHAVSAGLCGIGALVLVMGTATSLQSIMAQHS